MNISDNTLLGCLPHLFGGIGRLLVGIPTVYRPDLAVNQKVPHGYARLGKNWWKSKSRNLR